MALAAGGDDVGPAQVGSAVGCRQDVVRAVAVIALRRAGRPQTGHLAVEGVEESPGFLLVAPAALVHHPEPETGSVDPADRVGRMTILAGGQFLVGVTVSGPVDAGLADLLDAVVAGSAGVGHVVRIDR
jgi:hypothetical protein